MISVCFSHQHAAAEHTAVLPPDEQWCTCLTRAATTSQKNAMVVAFPKWSLNESRRGPTKLVGGAFPTAEPYVAPHFLVSTLCSGPPCQCLTPQKDSSFNLTRSGQRSALATRCECSLHFIDSPSFYNLSLMGEHITSSTNKSPRYNCLEVMSTLSPILCRKPQSFWIRLKLLSAW